MRIINALLIILFSYSCTHEDNTNDWYKVEIKALCEKENRLTAKNEDVLEYGRGTPYDLDISESAADKTVSFKFIAECCLEFYGSASIKQDTLKLKYWNTEKFAPCECLCDYQISFHLSRNRTNWKKIGVKLIQKQK